ncbi:hypothetical protein AQ490_24995 [Wenjunlia vitaminophila]|uniref:ATP-grasp ribosomal peptide maturase n=1 Tax=Wenjunlia vitaminophila TaxID=76728 RepID=A0A0T6LRL3_WENVI|nr:ATP-grasp ribosomal peptide maturase [Wenjunlia vitaminophila]KRV48529.1 hypothetical protein AQ490_24995 [Wenjunlia vitaminophila]
MSRTRNSVLVSAALEDQTADAVISELNGRGVPVARVDPGADFPTRCSLVARVNPVTGIHGVLETPSRRVLLDRVRSVYHRHPTPYGAAFEHLAEQDALFATAQARHGLGGVLAALPCTQVNHPHATAAASFKTVGLAVAVRAGLTVPPTLITSDPEAARSFAKKHGPVVYKVLRAARYRDQEDRPLTVWTTAVSPQEIDDGVAGTAHLFQARIDSIADVRITVVDGQLFAARIDSGLLDWRTDYRCHRYRISAVPDPVASGIRAYMRELRLLYAAFDFALTASGTWLFYEANPSGQYGWIEDATGLPITRAIADLLLNGACA